MPWATCKAKLSLSLVATWQWAENLKQGIYTRVPYDKFQIVIIPLYMLHL